MLGNLVVLFVLQTAVLFFLAGRLSERTKRLRETQTLLADYQLETRAYQNQLLSKQGSPPIFAEDGSIRVQPTPMPDGNPDIQIMKPPFAAANDEWDREEEKTKLTMQSLFTVPPLSESEKGRIRESLNGSS